MNEVDILYTTVREYLEDRGYKEAKEGIKPDQMRVGEYRLNRAGMKTQDRADVVALGHYGFTICEFKTDPEVANEEATTNQIDRYAAQYASWNGYIPRVHACGRMWIEDGSVVTEIHNYRTYETAGFEDLKHSPIGKKITNTHQWLKNLRQNFWRGQSYSHIDETLQRLLFAKYYAENEDLPYHVGNFVEIYEQARQDYLANTNVDMGKLPATLTNDPMAYRGTIETIQSVRISEDTNIWHIINHLWTERSLRKEDGQYFTPFAIKRFMVDVYPPDYNDKVCDPCGGSGGFVITAADSLDKFQPGRFYYYDSDGEKIAKVALRAFSTYRHPKSGKNLGDIKYAIHDSLDDTWHCKMNRIYTNVPFGHKVSNTATGKNGQNLLKNYDVGRGKASELSQLLFIEKCIDQLEDGGTFATVVDKGIVTNRKYTEDRAILARKAALELVVELPGVAFEHFAGTTFPTFLLFFRKGEPTFTRYEKVQNMGYDESGYFIREDGAGPFDSCLEEVNYESCDLAEILDRWNNKKWPGKPDPDHDYDYEKTETGNWLWGHWKYQNVKGKRLRDVANLVLEGWDGENDRNPTVDRRYRYVKETHLNPKAKSKTRTLREGCLLMSRLLSDDQTPSCGIIHSEYDGAGCTNENYIIRTNDKELTTAIWYLINFDSGCHDYLWSHCRGQGRGRIAEEDLLAMPVRKLTAEEKKKADILVDALDKKLKVDNYVERKFAKA